MTTLLTTLTYGSVAQANAKTTSKIYNFATPAGESTLTATAGQTLTTNLSPEINNYFAPMYVGTPAGAYFANISYLQYLGKSNNGLYTISTNNYSVYNIASSGPNSGAIQFTVVANASPFVVGATYEAVPNYVSGYYAKVTRVTILVDASGVRNYSFFTA